MNETTNVKEYLKNVFDLEGALYQHQQLVDGYISQRQNDAPSEPVKLLPSPPTEPVPRALPSFGDTLDSPIMQSLFGLFIAFALCSLVLLLSAWLMFIPQLTIAALLITLFVGILFFTIANAQRAKIKSANQADFDKYEKAMEAHQIDVNNSKKKYSNEMQIYTQQIAVYNRETDEQLKRFDEVKAILQTSLTELYSLNIVYSKYRNFVTIATIYEYFDSGRCTELEGPNGAYNMYEGELRSNIVISSLSQIISDLGQIKNGQYALYEQITRSNENVTRLLSNIYDAQMLNAYYSGATAIAATAAAAAASARKVIYMV